MDQAWMGSTLFLFTVSGLSYMLHSATREDRKGVLAVATRGRGSYTQAPRLKSIVVCFFYFSSRVTLSQPPSHVFILRRLLSVLLPPFLFHFLNPVPTLGLWCFNPFCIPLCQVPKGSRCLLQLCIPSAYRHLVSIKKCLLCENLTE